MKIIRKLSLLLSVLSILSLMSLLSCTANPTDSDSESDSSTDAAEAELYKTDREILTDYENIEISGEHDVRIMFVNAGKADSIIVEADGKYYIIDTGETTSVPKINAALEYMGADKIEAVFLTHSHSDHIGGIPMLSEIWEIGSCYTGAISVDMGKIQTAIEKSSLEQTILEPGSVVELSEGLYFEVLGPIRYNPLDDNDNSLVLRMTLNGVTVLLTGDMQYDEEKTLMRAGYDLRCDVLKVGNHGNKDATSTSFIEETSPSHAIITTDRAVDENSAHKSVQNGLKQIGAEVYVTDEYDIGVLCEISRDGEIEISNAKVDPDVSGIKLSSISKDDQTVVIKNTGSREADLSGWFIVSDRGGEVFIFPEGTTIPPSSELTVACTEYNGSADLTWQDSRVWHKTKDDSGKLIDRYGNTIAEMLSE